MDRQALQRWLDSYVEAWRSYDPQRIEELFSEDAVYHRSAYSRPIHGRSHIVAAWLTHRDDPARWEATYEPLLVEGDSGVATGVTRYYADAEHTRLDDEYSNVFLVRFDGESRCREYREWWMQRPRQGPTGS